MTFEHPCLKLKCFSAWKYLFEEIFVIGRSEQKIIEVIKFIERQE